MLTRTGPGDGRAGLAADPSACAVVLESRLGQAYNEEAFRYFLALERRASERSARSFLLLLLALRRRTGMSGRIDPAVAPPLFHLLWQCLRETDIVGWFRDGRVIGALLTQLSGTPEAAAARVDERVRARLSRSLAPGVASRLRIRICHVPSRPRERG
jgi:hypothetical protein